MLIALILTDIVVVLMAVALYKTAKRLKTLGSIVAKTWLNFETLKEKYSAMEEDLRKLVENGRS